MMKVPMKCCEFEQQITLLAGGDLDASLERGVQTHLAGCNDCRGRLDSLIASVAVLQSCQHHDPRIESASIRSRVQNHLQRRRAETGIRHFNGWVAGIAVAATVLACFSIARVPVSDPIEFNSLQTVREFEPRQVRGVDLGLEEPVVPVSLQSRMVRRQRFPIRFRSARSQGF